MERQAFHEMREWKRARGRELGYANPCVICHNRTLIEIVRRLPRNKTELLAIWGMSEKRYNSHGALMLQALAPLRQELQVAATERRQRILENSAATSSSKDPIDMASNKKTLVLGNGEAHPSWAAKHEKEGLPTCDWPDRRTWCVKENNCQSCLSRGPRSPWGTSCERLFNRMSDVYGNHHGGGVEVAGGEQEEEEEEEEEEERTRNKHLKICRDAGWRWFANPKPSTNSHGHMWWPPMSSLHTLNVSEKIPMSTGKAYKMICLIEEEIQKMGHDY